MGLLLDGDMELAKPTVTGSPVTIQEDDNGAIDSGYKVSHNNKPLTVSPDLGAVLGGRPLSAFCLLSCCVLMCLYTMLSN